MSNFVKIRPVGAELSLADGRTSGQACMTMPPVAFRSFADAPTNTFVLRNRSSHQFRYLGLSQK